MKKRTVLLPKQQRILQGLGENIKMARLRRRLSADQVSERAGIARKTLWAIENGHSTVSMGGYLQVLFILGLDKDMADAGREDAFGRRLQDAELTIRKRAPKKKPQTVLSRILIFFVAIYYFVIGSPTTTQR